MIIVFEDKELKKLIFEGQSKKYRAYARDRKFLDRLRLIYSYIEPVANTDALQSISFLHYEKLKGVGLSSIRIFNNRVERLIFEEVDGGIKIIMIELNKNHYDNL